MSKDKTTGFITKFALLGSTRTLIGLTVGGAGSYLNIRATGHGFKCFG